MATHRALVLSSFSEPLALKELPTPVPVAGEAVVAVLAASITPYMLEICNGTRPYPLALPLTIGSSAIGRVIAVGPDATSLGPGQLVLVEQTIRARDNPDEQFLLGMHSGMTQKTMGLMEKVWRHGTFAEVVRIPIENVHAMDEDRLLNKLRYTPADLTMLSTCLVPFGGLSDADVRPGDTVVVAPATGRFGGAAVVVALALGAKVVALGRNAAQLEKLRGVAYADERLVTVTLSGDAETDQKALAGAVGPNAADVYIDFSPPAAGAKGTPSHMSLCIGSLRSNGIVSIMGGIQGNVELPYSLIMFKNLKVRGKFMYDRGQVRRMLKMLENGNLKLGKAAVTETVGSFRLDQADEALKVALDNSSWGSNVVFVPRGGDGN